MNSIERKLHLILKRLDTIEHLLQNQESESISHFISEHDATKLLKKGTTWFWNLRQAGLPYYKVGGQVYYKKTDLVNLLDQGSDSLTSFD